MLRLVAQPLVVVDAENVRRSTWPNLSKEELVERCRAWANDEGMRLLVVFDGSPTIKYAQDAHLTFGPGPVSFAVSGTDVTTAGTPNGTATPRDCSDAWVTF